MVKSGQTWVVEFVTSSSTGAATDSDSLPAGVLVVNGADNAASVTVTKITTGRYKAAVTLPTLAAGDVVEMAITATIGGIAAAQVVARDVADTVRVSDVDAVLTAIKGAGWTTETLVAIQAAIGTRLAASSYTAPPSAATVADAVWDELLTGASHNIATSAGRRLRQLADVVITDGTVVSATSASITLDAGASATDGAYDPALIAITDGPGSGQCRLIMQYVGSTRTATVDRDWKVNPTSASSYQIVAHPGREHVNEGLARAATATTITLNANASTQNDAYTGQVIFIRAGTGADQVRLVTDYDGALQKATVETWDVTPDTTSVYVMLPSAYMSSQAVRDAMKLAPSAGAAATGSIDDLLANLASIPAVTLASILAGTALTIERNASISFTVTGMGDISDRTKLAFTMKAASDLADTQAYLKIEKVEAGAVNHITRINKAAPATGTDADGTITVDDAVAGDVTITVAPRSAALIPLTSGIWDVVRWDAAGAKHIEAYGSAVVQSTATASAT